MDFHAQSNISFIRHKIHELEKFTEKKRPFTRLVFSKEFYEARVWLKDEYLKLGLSVSTDEAGNLIGTLNSKINTIERGLDGGNSISTQHGIIQDEVTNDLKKLNDTLELHSSNIAALEVKMNNEFSAKIKSLEASIDELKTISMKNQTNTSDLQAMVLKLSTNSKS